jgi:hypothetical protein
MLYAYLLNGFLLCIVELVQIANLKFKTGELTFKTAVLKFKTGEVTFKTAVL